MTHSNCWNASALFKTHSFWLVSAEISTLLWSISLRRWLRRSGELCSNWGKTSLPYVSHFVVKDCTREQVKQKKMRIEFKKGRLIYLHDIFLVSLHDATRLVKSLICFNRKNKICFLSLYVALINRFIKLLFKKWKWICWRSINEPASFRTLELAWQLCGSMCLFFFYMVRINLSSIYTHSTAYCRSTKWL